MEKIRENRISGVILSCKSRCSDRRVIGYITGLLTVVTLFGCAEMDPWQEMTRAPSSASSIFVAPSQDAVAVEPPASTELQVHPEIKDRALTLSDCIKIALERNPETRETWQIARSAAARVGEEKATYFPSAELALTGERADPVSLDNKETHGPKSTYETRSSIGYLLFDGGARSARVSGAEAELLAANFRHNTTLQEVALVVEEAYYESLAAKWVLKVAQETVKQTQYHVDLARARHKSGLVARSDVLKAETERANADLFMVKANSTVKVAMGKLASTVGLKVSQPLEIAEHSKEIPEQELVNIDLLFEEAAKSRPELRAVLAQIESKRANVKVAEAQYWPVIGMDAGYGSRDDTFVPSKDKWSVGIGLSLPLFTGFDRTYRLQRAKSELAAASAEYEKLLRDVELEVWNSYLAIIEADQTVQASKKLVASAEQSARVAEAEYKNGTAFMIELIDAQTARTIARTYLIQARFDWYTAIARFERAVGQTLAKRGVATSSSDSER